MTITAFKALQLKYRHMERAKCWVKADIAAIQEINEYDMDTKGYQRYSRHEKTPNLDEGLW